MEVADQVVKVLDKLGSQLGDLAKAGSPYLEKAYKTMCYQYQLEFFIMLIAFITFAALTIISWAVIYKKWEKIETANFESLIVVPIFLTIGALVTMICTIASIPQLLNPEYYVIQSIFNIK